MIKLIYCSYSIQEFFNEETTSQILKKYKNQIIQTFY